MFNSNKLTQLIGGFLAIGFTLIQGIDWVFKKYEIDNFYFNILLILLLISFAISIFFYLFKKKFNKKKEIKLSRKNRVALIINISITSFFLIILFVFFKKNNKTRNLIDKIIPEIVQLYDDGKTFDVFKLTKTLKKEFPDNKLISSYFKKSSQYSKFKLNKDGVDLYVAYGNDSTYDYLGKTPIDSIVVPNFKINYVPHKIKIIDGQNVYYESYSADHDYILPNQNVDVPENHIVFLGRNNLKTGLQGLYLSDFDLPPFSISKYEVSNKEFQEFVDDGGYENPKFWEFPITIDQKNYDFSSTVKKFTGKYGKLGPSNWSYGKFPNGMDNHPVNGISWFEARAFAKYKNLEIPNIFQWIYAAKKNNLSSLNFLDKSNFNTSQTREVFDERGSTNNLNNIAGNVKEWVSNTSDATQKKYPILGGSFNEYSYTFDDFYEVSPFNRSKTNGIRLSKNLGVSDNEIENQKIIVHKKRNILDEPDVTDEVFEVYKSQFDYKKEPLNATIEILDGFDPNYTVEKFEFNTAYSSDEKLHGYIVYSNKVKGPFNPVIMYPNASSMTVESDDDLPSRIIRGSKYLTSEGFAVIHPIYFNTFSRDKILNSFFPDESEVYKEAMIKIGKDFKRSIDYIDSRNDLISENLSYFGYSWGSIISNILLAIDDRIKSAFICVGGLPPQKSKKEVEAHYFLRRIKTPIFHIVGKTDGIFGNEQAFKPWKELVGTKTENLKIIELENVGHGIPGDMILSNHVNWIRKYMVK
tara:strand:- start:400 stop:2658 length:2259 start_codon:yes stop_codon:yes gene_type:complete